MGAWRKGAVAAPGGPEPMGEPPAPETVVDDRIAPARHADPGGAGDEGDEGDDTAEPPPTGPQEPSQADRSVIDDLIAPRPADDEGSQ